MLSIALTGGIGCGKTTVCNLFSKLHVPIIDTDVIARELVEPGRLALEEIINAFGSHILLEDGSLNRQELAKIVFQHNKNKIILENILHPKIRAEVKQQLAKNTYSYSIIAIPLLIETKQENKYDRVLVIDCNEQQQIERTLDRDQRSLEQVESIVKAQTNRLHRLSFANDIIDNTSTIESLKKQVEHLHRTYLDMSHA